MDQVDPKLPVANVRNAVAELSENCGIVTRQIILNRASPNGIWRNSHF
jgi:hypothetical protein